MNSILTSTVRAIAMGLCLSAAASAQQPSVGNMLRVDLKSAEHPRAYHPVLGDLVQCHYDFNVVPDQMIEDLKVRIDGRSVVLVAVVNTTPPKIVGAGQISLFLVPREEGLSHVQVTPVIQGKEGDPIKISFLVEARQPESR